MDIKNAPVSDLRARAAYLHNQSAMAERAGDYDEAERLLQDAIRLDEAADARTRRLPATMPSYA